MAFRRKCRYIILHFTRRQSRFCFSVINLAWLYCVSFLSGPKMTMKTTVTLDENSRTCPTLLVSCFPIKFLWLLIECLFIITPGQMTGEDCDDGITYDPSQMSMSHTMINSCQLKILKSFFPGRDTAAGFTLSPLEKYERIMGHFSQNIRGTWRN